MAWKALCQLNELQEGKGKYVEVGAYQLAVFLSNGQPHVMDNFCPHAGGNLAGGRVEAGCAICPWHDWAFRLDNGQLRDSQYVKVNVYPARVLNQPGQPALVLADLPEASP
jgi:nitrite reductase/ring-hydroxylating ferredoxin subunit